LAENCLWAGGADFAAEAGVIVELNGVEPRVDVVAGFAVLSDVFRKTGESLLIDMEQL
jgi:hypothetical protein